jgi:hypothetical protein
MGWTKCQTNVWSFRRTPPSPTALLHASRTITSQYHRITRTKLRSMYKTTLASGHTNPLRPIPLGALYNYSTYSTIMHLTQSHTITYPILFHHQSISCFMSVPSILKHQQSLATAAQSVHLAQKLRKTQLIFKFKFSFDFPPQYANIKQHDKLTLTITIADLELLVIETIHTRSSMTFRKFSSRSHIVLR